MSRFDSIGENVQSKAVSNIVDVSIIDNVANFVARVGCSRCIRCDFKTDEREPLDVQDRKMYEHLDAKHPGWRLDGVKVKDEISTSGYFNKLAPAQLER